MNVASLCREIRGAKLAESDDLRALIAAVSSRVLDEVRDELHPALELLDRASDACPDVTPPPAPQCRSCEAAADDGRAGCSGCLREARRAESIGWRA